LQIGLKGSAMSINSFAVVGSQIVDLRSDPTEEPLITTGIHDRRRETQLLPHRCVHIIKEENGWSYVDIPEQPVIRSETLIPYRGWVKSSSLQSAFKCQCRHNPNELLSQEQICKVVETAQSYFKSPYLWGGLGLDIDCSGLVYKAYEEIVRLPRNSGDMYHMSSQALPQNMKPGDLIFSAPSNTGRVNHVMLWTGSDILESIGEYGVRSITFKERFGMTLSDLKEAAVTVNTTKLFFHTFIGGFPPQLPC
jgi:hypothetical protein